mmetsp:Transcript_82819/g.221273  ORF Transcript_82819/g.221273 Transcript_82819/m.221273 type:complete len:356 (+) Transcript_82819:44-1111(+)
MVVMGSAPKPEELVQQMKQVIGMWSELEELERLSAAATAKTADNEEVIGNRIRRCGEDLHRSLSDLVRCKSKLALEAGDAVPELQTASGLEAALGDLERLAASVAQDVAAVTAALVSGEVTVLKKGECKSVQEVLASVAEAEQALQGCEQAALLRLTNLLENLCVEVTDLQAERLSADQTIQVLKEKNSVLIEQMQQSGLDVKVEASPAPVHGQDDGSGERRGTAVFGLQSRGSLDQSSILGSEQGREPASPPLPWEQSPQRVDDGLWSARPCNVRRVNATSTSPLRSVHAPVPGSWTPTRTVPSPGRLRSVTTTTRWTQRGASPGPVLSRRGPVVVSSPVRTIPVQRIPPPLRS